MGKCKAQCNACKLQYHSLPKFTKRYAITINSYVNQHHIQVNLPEPLFKQLKLLKENDQSSFTTAAVELLKDII